MIPFAAFSEELVKIAESDIPIVKRLPRDREAALRRVSKAIDKSKTTILGYPSVAVDVRQLGDLSSIGFKRTRLAVPLPWERVGARSWRKGKLHAHKKGQHFVLHKDKLSPKGVVMGAKHWVEEGIPAAKDRFLNKHPEFRVV